MFWRDAAAGLGLSLLLLGALGWGLLAADVLCPWATVAVRGGLGIIK